MGINNANVAIADIQTLNGVVHVLDAVILPPSATVADVVINSDVHETLEGAVIAADLAGTLSDLAGTFTVFAPTDDAFAALDPAVLNILTSNADTKLRRALSCFRSRSNVNRLIRWPDSNYAIWTRYYSNNRCQWWSNDQQRKCSHCRYSNIEWCSACARW